MTWSACIERDELLTDGNDIREIIREPSCGCNREIVRETPCGCNKKPKVIVHQRREPIIINGPERSVVIPAGKPIRVRTAPVLIRRPGIRRFENKVFNHQKPALHFTQKITEVERPVLKKYFVEQFERQVKGCGPEIIDKRILPQPRIESERVIIDEEPRCDREREVLVEEPRFNRGEEFIDEQIIDDDGLGLNLRDRIDRLNLGDDVEVERVVV